jgi:hypothetical protein
MSSANLSVIVSSHRQPLGSARVASGWRPPVLTDGSARSSPRSASVVPVVMFGAQRSERLMSLKDCSEAVRVAHARPVDDVDSDRSQWTSASLTARSHNVLT